MKHGGHACGGSLEKMAVDGFSIQVFIHVAHTDIGT